MSDLSEPDHMTDMAVELGIQRGDKIHPLKTTLKTILETKLETNSKSYWKPK